MVLVVSLDIVVGRPDVCCTPDKHGRWTRELAIVVPMSVAHRTSMDDQPMMLDWQSIGEQTLQRARTGCWLEFSLVCQHGFEIDCISYNQSECSFKVIKLMLNLAL